MSGGGGGGAVWRSPAFLGLFGDPYLRGTPFAFGGNPQALLATLTAIPKLLQRPRNGEGGGDREEEPVSFPMSGAQEAFVRDTLVPQLQQCAVWVEKGVKVADAPQFQAFLREWRAFLDTLTLHAPVLVPGGYVGNTTSHTMLYIVEKTSEAPAVYRFTVCNKGPGAEMYHPSTITPHDNGAAGGAVIASACDKLRVQPFVEIAEIPATRFLDMAFWSLLFSLWVRKPPSEYHRVETIYDVLLPWLAGDKLLPLVMDESLQEVPVGNSSISTEIKSALAAGRTPQRANLGFCKSVIEAVRYLCLTKGGFAADLFDFKYTIMYQMRYRMLKRMVHDLECARDPRKSVPSDALDNAMRALSTISLLDSLQGSHSLTSIKPDAVVAVYFAKQGHPVCRRLTASLTTLTERLGDRFVVIIVSVDQEQREYAQLVADLPPTASWRIVSFEETNVRKQLVQAFGVSSLPTLIMRDTAGKVLTPLGKDLVESDPTGAAFPWVETDSFRLPSIPVSDSERLCIQAALKQTGLKTLRHHHSSAEEQPLRSSALSTLGLQHVNEVMNRAEVLLTQLHNDSLTSNGSKSGTTGEKYPKSSFSDALSFCAHTNMDLLQIDGQDDRYAGSSAEIAVPELASFLDVPERVSSIPLAVGAFMRCRHLCESLLRRAADGSSSSRVSLHHEVIQLVTTLFVEVLPVPTRPPGDRQIDTCMWRQSVTQDMQLKCLEHVYSCLMILGSVWQSMEQPSRQFDSERALAALCGLAIFDSLLRTPATDTPMEISTMMGEEGGYVLSHHFCKANRSLRAATAAMELTRPRFCITRGQVLAYFDARDGATKHELFAYHMPEDKLEIKKYSTTLIFFRRLMERYHYELIDVNDPTPPTEMEALMEWFCGDESRMAAEHPEVALARDLVLVVKFLVTMETKEVELMRRRVTPASAVAMGMGMGQYQNWQLSFDDDNSSSTHRRNFFGMRGLERILHGRVKWEVSNFRGSDQDICDVDVVGFMERKIYFGEGPMIVSPSDLNAVLLTNGEGPLSASLANPGAATSGTVVTEDDIMHTDHLPSFQGTLSAEEAEYLLSYLTVPYARVPLIVSFFASRDRVTYLFNPQLQRLFRAVLFEGGDWVLDDGNQENVEITHIPLRKSSLLLREEAVDRVMDARLQHQRCEDHLGTMNGLLLNEIRHAPDAILRPLLKMLDSIRELGEASVHSSDARFILFMIKLGVDVLRYSTFVVDSMTSEFASTSDRAHARIVESYREKLMAYAFGFAFDTLEKWRLEAESVHNLQTACVIHSYIVLLYVGLRPSEYTHERVARMMGSIAYVRNWHCFGMKVSAAASNASGTGDGGLSAEDRLLRWLQAQGINTENVTKESLDKYLKGRPLYLKVGMQTIQAPSIVALRSQRRQPAQPKQSGSGPETEQEEEEEEELKLPPGEVLEVETFEALQIHRRGVIKWLQNLEKSTLGPVLGEIVRIALRSNEPDSTWRWQEAGTGVQHRGRYRCSVTELQLDVQTGEILWRNDELKPLPDSMTQYADFTSLFGNKALHCGLVVRQEHRHWVKIVGTDYELVEWDDPTDPVDQGVGVPTVYTAPSLAVDAESDQLHANELKMYWECGACTSANFNGDDPRASCDVCGTSRFPPPSVVPPTSRDGDASAKVGISGFEYVGDIFSRVLDIYSEEEHPHPDEQWAVELVGNAMRLLYPPEPEEKKLPFPIFLPSNPLTRDARFVRLIGHDQGDEKEKEKQQRRGYRPDKLATFKEIIALRDQQVVHIYALVSHGRRVFRKLIFTTNSSRGLHGFPLNVNPDAGPVDPMLLAAGGDPRERQAAGGSLVILRRSRSFNAGNDTYEQFVPARLLQGVVPSCLLEAFQFWRGGNGILRGDPLDAKSQWFRYRVRVDMARNGLAVISRWSLVAPGQKATTLLDASTLASASTGSTFSQRHPPPAPMATTGINSSFTAARASATSATTVVSDEDVVQLMSMGFSYVACGLALRGNQGNVGMAAQWLLDEVNQTAIAEAEVAAASGSDGAVVLTEEEIYEQNIGILLSLEMSPSRATVEYALEIFGRDVELARAWLEDSANSDEIERVELSAASSSSAPADLPTPPANSEYTEKMDTCDVEDDKTGAAGELDSSGENEDETLLLLNLLDTKCGGIRDGDDEISRIVNLLGQIEDISHILVWCHRPTNGEMTSMIDGSTSIAFVELPRLKIKLRPQFDVKSGSVRFYVMDQNGWFVSDITAATIDTPVSSLENDSTAYLRALLSIVPKAWLLESETNDLRLVCPNHDLHRPSVAEEPLSRLILPDRASVGWQQAMETRFYAYPIHSSRTFLLPPSLSATLYLILASLLSKRYDVAMPLIQGCNVDVRFTDEEKWLFDQLMRTVDDRHPNACACRIRLTLGIAYSDNKAPWKLSAELHDYVSTLAHVDAECRLTGEEEREALAYCHQRSPLLALRKQACEHLGTTDEGNDMSGDQVKLFPTAPITVKLTRNRVGGQPWMKLRLYTSKYLNEHGKKLSTVRYNRPKHAVVARSGIGAVGGSDMYMLLDEEEAGKLVWNCAVVGDEVSGTNRGLGFLFLYECVVHQVGISLGGEDCTQSFADLFTRFLHLKLSRWGRETVEDGEEESAPSFALAQLAMMLAHPEDQNQWPTSPAAIDAESTRMLSFGANLYSRATFGSSIKSFFDFGEVAFQSKLDSSDHQERIVAPLKAQFARSHETSEREISVRVLSTTTIEDTQNDGEWGPSNSACSARTFDSQSKLMELLSNDAPMLNPEFPLDGTMDISSFITFCDPESTLSTTLPFDLSKHPAAQSVAARDILVRLGDDVAANAKAVNESKDAFFTGVTPRDVFGTNGTDTSQLAESMERVQGLVRSCERVRSADRRMVDAWITQIEAEANLVATRGRDRDGLDGVTRFVLQRRMGLYPRVRFDFLTALLASDSFGEDLKRRNPYFAARRATESAQNGFELMERTLVVLFLCNRIVHTNRTIQLANALIGRLKHPLHDSATEDLYAVAHAKQTLQASKDLADALLSKRHYLRSATSDSIKSQWSFDPRFLIFEYVFDLLLRGRQVQMIDSFLSSVERGDSRVQQMIMGAGKTTVVGPLLTYILADRIHLITHVMPTALLEQSRQVLRSRFSNSVLRKRIFTFEFDRSVADDPELARKMFAKLNRARRHGDVVCASPESIKSMMLKMVELLHSLEESKDVIAPKNISRSLVAVSQNTRRLRSILEHRSEMADELHRTIRLWQQGVLIMDEVDVLLHPLRSELNFPIGNKFPIDLAANRWELPIHLIDAVLLDNKREKHQVNANSNANHNALVDRLHTVLHDGYTRHALQRFPHLVLLDMAFYESEMLPLVAALALEWLLPQFKMGKMDVPHTQLTQYLTCSRNELYADAVLRSAIESGLSETSIKLLNLARDWVRTLLPHVLSKINRVSYGLLRTDTDGSGAHAPSRLLLAVPFVGKDVPSRSSEFAHPDVLIGLTLLAYRYEGLRATDLVRVVAQLKQDFSRQLGPRDQRPACATFREWVATGLAKTKEANNTKGGGGVLPLPLFQPRDPSQLARLHTLVAQLSGVVYHYLRQHVFPACMNFQKLKLSACGHELGGDALFATRIGFSGTPSNLLPLDLGDCVYEPRSDGSIFQTLTNPRVVSLERKLNWTARSLLLDIARARNPPYHALIDTGALITGFENQEVAAFLLEHLPSEMEGVVFLDADDRQMILVRDHAAAMPLVQCGLSADKRFTFYDQVHTTGMDIKQAVNACAVLTLGKDMTFRDYAQGAYRMRGIETGQSIRLFMIPEVENRIRHEAALAQSPALTALMSRSGKGDLERLRGLNEFLLLVPAWLLVNSMRMEAMQLVQLSLQELHNTWRKRALHSLLDEMEEAHRQRHVTIGNARLRRFIENGDGSDRAAVEWLRECVVRFREGISYAVESAAPTRKALIDVVDSLVAQNVAFVQTPAELERVEAVKQRLAHSSSEAGGADATEHAEMGLTAEVVHENEQEAEEEAEEEAEQEEQKMSAFMRDDEHPIPWAANTLAEAPACCSQDADANMDTIDDDAVFYPLSRFQAHNECPAIAFPSSLLVSGNFFRRRWVGLGSRRVKNVGLVLEWAPTAEQESMKMAVQHLFLRAMANGGMAPNDAAVVALREAQELAHQHPEDVDPALRDAVTSHVGKLPVFLAAVSLAEGETLRRMIHTRHSVLQNSQLRLRTCEGELVESSSLVAAWGDPTAAILTEMKPASPPPSPSLSARQEAVMIGVQCLRFFNNEMYYTPGELTALLNGLEQVPLAMRHELFACCLRLRRRERRLWGDTPLAKVFTHQDEWHLLSARARLQQFQQSLARKARKRKHKGTENVNGQQDDRRVHLATALRRFDSDNDGRLNADETRLCLESFQLGFSSAELHEILTLIADPSAFDSHGGVAMATICAAFGISEQEMEDELRREDEALTKSIEAEAGTAAPWQCAICTFVNVESAAAATCGACHEPNPNAASAASTAVATSSQGWQCGNCTFLNLAGDTACAICELGADGRRAVPRGKWVCAGEQGGCTFFNSMSHFYCDVCHRARPDLAATQF